MKNIFKISGVILLIFLIHACKKDKPTPPVLTTSAVTEISYTTATSGGAATNEGGAPIVTKGVCWNTSADPTIANSKTTESSGLGVFTSQLTGLNPNTMYYVRAYGTNSTGTAYGNEVSFKTLQLEVPVLTTTEITSITQTTAVSGGNITDDNGGSVTARGVCWGTATNPTTADSKTTDGTGTGSFVSNLTGLTANTTYYLRAYATNSVGTAYGNEISFTTTASISDIDGNVYNTVTIGTQVWMKENLKTSKYNNGDLIGTTTPATKDISLETTPKYQWVYDGNESNVATYGRLYTWYAVTDSRNICPKGWHVPTDIEWSALNSFLGGEGVSGGKLKETGLSHWITPNSDANNSSGFTAIPGGWRYYGGASEYLGYFSYWWSSTEGNVDNAWWRQVNYVNPGFSRNTMNKKYGLSVRCIKDN